MLKFGHAKGKERAGFLDPPLIDYCDNVIDYNTTLNDGYLGSLFEEERSEVR